MRNYFYSIPILTFLFVLPAFAGTDEEQGCFDILKDYVVRDARFGGEDITNAYIGNGRGGGARKDLSEYLTGFIANRSRNYWDAIFTARRNNIGTIIVGSDYIASQFVTFGDNSNFQFPLPSGGWRRLGENYGNFKNRVIYTHHLIAPGHPDDGVFISCAFFKIVPAPGKTLNDVDPSNYKTNEINASGFALLVGPEAPLVKNGHRYIVGKVNVPVNNYNDQHQMTIEMITIAHDTQSELFNEFETFPLQVKAMTDMDARDDVNTVQLRFLRYVKEQTCLKIPHTDLSDLPSLCGGAYKSLSTTPVVSSPSIIRQILSWISESIIPSALARMEPMTEKQLKEHNITETSIPQGMYISPDFRFDLREKLDVIGNNVLTSYVLQAMNEGAEKVMHEKQKKGIALTADENTFLNCGIDFKTRVRVISDWLSSVDPKAFDTTHITYSDPRIGDCILPFPDARHRMIIIPESFAINQYNAAILSNNTGEIERLTRDLQIDTSTIDPSFFGGLNYYNPLYNGLARIALGILLLVTGGITVIFIVRNGKKE